MNILKNLFFISLLLPVIFILTGCKKESKELTTVDFYLHNPVTGEAFSGVAVKILLKKQKNKPFVIASEYESSVLWEGTTDANGKASYSFNAYKDSKYQYWSVVDQSLLNSYDAIIQPSFESLNKNVSNQQEYQLTKKVNCVKWIKNINFFDENDQFSYRLKEITFPFKDWYSWKPSGSQSDMPTSFFEGNYELMSSVGIENQNIWEIEMITIRNGITTTKLDTFYVTGQNGTDTMKLFY